MHATACEEIMGRAKAAKGLGARRLRDRGRQPAGSSLGRIGRKAEVRICR